MSGWVKLHRQIQYSDMFKSLNSKQRDVLIQCLLLANHEENTWVWGKDSYTCKPGQFVTSLEKLKGLCAKDVQTQTIRTTLNKLEKWKFLTNTSTKTGRLLTICKWDTYQNSEMKTNKDRKINQQTSNKQLTDTLTPNKKKEERIQEVRGDNGLPLDYRKWSDNDFKKVVWTFREKYSVPELKNFFEYWTEKTPQGKCRFQIEKTWDTTRRLTTAKRMVFNNMKEQEPKTKVDHMAEEWEREHAK